MASCWLMKNPTTITTYSYVEIKMRVWLLVIVFLLYMMIKRVHLQFLVKFRATFFLDNVNPREIREKSIVICGQLKKNKITASEP